MLNSRVRAVLFAVLVFVAGYLGWKIWKNLADPAVRPLTPSEIDAEAEAFRESLDRSKNVRDMFGDGVDDNPDDEAPR